MPHTFLLFFYYLKILIAQLNVPALTHITTRHCYYRIDVTITHIVLSSSDRTTLIRNIVICPVILKLENAQIKNCIWRVNI